MEDNLPLVTADTVRNDLVGCINIINDLSRIGNALEQKGKEFFLPYEAWSNKAQDLDLDKKSVFDELFFLVGAEKDARLNKIFRGDVKRIELCKLVDFIQDKLVDSSMFDSKRLQDINDVSVFPDTAYIINCLEGILSFAKKFQEDLKVKYEQSPLKELKSLILNGQSSTIEKKLLHDVLYANSLNAKAVEHFDMVLIQFPSIIKKIKDATMPEKPKARNNKKGSPKPLKVRGKIKDLLNGILKRIATSRNDIYLTREQVAKMYGCEDATPDAIEETTTHAISELNRALKSVKYPAIGRYDKQKGWPCPISLKKYKNILK